MTAPWLSTGRPSNKGDGSRRLDTCPHRSHQGVACSSPACCAAELRHVAQLVVAGSLSLSGWLHNVRPRPTSLSERTRRTSAGTVGGAFSFRLVKQSSGARRWRRADLVQGTSERHDTGRIAWCGVQERERQDCGSLLAIRNVAQPKGEGLERDHLDHHRQRLDHEDAPRGEGVSRSRHGCRARRAGLTGGATTA